MVVGQSTDKLFTVHIENFWTTKRVIPDILIVIPHFLDTEIGMLSYHVPRCPGKVSLHLLERLVEIDFRNGTMVQWYIGTLLKDKLKQAKLFDSALASFVILTFQINLR